MHYFLEDRFHEGVFTLAVADTQWLYGSGFFETILYNGHAICHLERHLKRIHQSLEHFGIAWPHETDFEQVILRLIKDNQYTLNTCRINIYYFLKSQALYAYPLVTVTAYQRPIDKDIRLITTPWLHESYLNSHKTLSYLPHTLAYTNALKHNYFDALFTDTQNTLLECSRGSLMFEAKGTLFKIKNTGNLLPSISLQLVEQNTPLKEATITLNDLPRYQHAYYLNSLIGVVPITAINEHTFAPNIYFCQNASKHIVLSEKELSPRGRQ